MPFNPDVVVRPWCLKCFLGEYRSSEDIEIVFVPFGAHTDTSDAYAEIHDRTHNVVRIIPWRSIEAMFIHSGDG